MSRDFLCGHANTARHKQHGRCASDIIRENLAVEVEARIGVRDFPAQARGQAEVDELLNLCVRRAGVRRPVKRGDNFASLDANEIVPEFRAIAIEVLRDDERAKGSVDVELCFFIFHVYRIAQGSEKARDFFTIM